MTMRGGVLAGGAAGVCRRLPRSILPLLNRQGGGERSRSHQPWTVDSEGGVWTSQPPVRPPPPPALAGKAGGPTHKKGKRRGGGTASGVARGKANRGGKAESEEEGRGGLHPASVRLGGGDIGGAAAASAEGDERAERGTGQQREDYLDKAQVGLVWCVVSFYWVDALLYGQHRQIWQEGWTSCVFLSGQAICLLR